MRFARLHSFASLCLRHCSTCVAWLDIVDNWTNQINLIVIGILECIAVGWCFQIDKVWQQINRNTKKFKMPRIWIRLAIRYIAPATLLILFVWNLYVLFVQKGGHYGYALWAECLAGWLVSALVFASGFILKLIVRHKKKQDRKSTRLNSSHAT